MSGLLRSEANISGWRGTSADLCLVKDVADTRLGAVDSHGSAAGLSAPCILAMSEYQRGLIGAGVMDMGRGLNEVLSTKGPTKSVLTLRGASCENVKRGPCAMTA